MKGYKYKRMTEKEIEDIIRLHSLKMEMRKIARYMKRNLSAIQYQIKKNCEKQKKLTNI